jgi:hypothetical protein
MAQIKTGWCFSVQQLKPLRISVALRRIGDDGRLAVDMLSTTKNNINRAILGELNT